MKLSRQIMQQLESVDLGPETEVLRHYGGPRRFICWLGFHDVDEYIGSSEEYTYTTNVCKCCGRKLYVSYTEESYDRDEDED